MRNLLAAAALVAVPATTGAQTITVLGDSLTQGYGLPEEDGFVPRLQAWLRANGEPDAIVINAGVSGDTSAGGLARVGWTLTEDVDAVILALGANDVLRGVNPMVTRENLDGILTVISERGLPVILAGIPAPGNYGPEYQAAFDAIFPELAAEHGAILYPSFLRGMGEGRDLGTVRRYLQSDGLHPNAEGVEVNVAAIGPVVLELIAAARY